MKIETGAEEERRHDKIERAKQVQETIDYTTGLLWYYGDPHSQIKWTYEKYNKTVIYFLMKVSLGTYFFPFRFGMICKIWKASFWML